MAKNLCGSYIRQLRLKQDITLEEMAATLAVEHQIVLDRSNLGRIENGHRAVSDYELVAFSRLFHVSFEQLLGLDKARDDEDLPPPARKRVSRAKTQR